MNKLLVVSPSPHTHSGESTSRLMFNVVLALVPAFAVTLFYFGMGALVVTLISITSCLLFEYLIQKFLLKVKPTISDGSALVTGLILAFNLPSNLPWWIVVIGAIIAIGVGKMSFGGLGNNPFNPALVGRVFLLISFPVHMTSWPLPIES
ncbi:MAG TPA: RnfABCDGE type electron transport complex subunit D, partial [Tenuifilaceae bacterium]|nr:RnfABCDGE type electron transport complex subunit D [Tenuifilaceae bacterium]